jgi:hypothetical protein
LKILEKIESRLLQVGAIVLVFVLAMGPLPGVYQFAAVGRSVAEVRRPNSSHLGSCPANDFRWGKDTVLIALRYERT